jgi:thiol:disulfide interchange protein
VNAVIATITRTARAAALCCAAAMMIAGETGCKRLRNGPDVTWYDGIENGEAAVRKQHKPALVVFRASWDSATKELEGTTFLDRDVREVLDHDFVAITVDCTDEDVPATEAAQRRFKIVGVPTILILAPDFRTELRRYNEFMDERKMMAALEATRGVR